MSSGINYAQYIGIHSEAAAIVFAILYFPLGVWFIYVLLGHLRRFVLMLTLFCFIRVAAFVIRAILAASTSAAGKLNLIIGEEILLSIGYFGLLFAAYSLVLDRTEALEQEFPQGSPEKRTLPLPIRLLRDRRLFHVVLLVAIILGIVGISTTTSGQSSSTLRKASVGIFFALTVLQALNTLFLLNLEFNGQRLLTYPPHASFGLKHGAVILLAISVLLLVREIFVTATLGNIGVYQNEHFWYPLVAVPELVAAALYLIPGLIPRL